MGGHKPKAIAGEHHAFLVQRIREREFTLRGLVAEFAERGLKVDYRSVWNFVHAEKLSFKKNRHRQRTRSPRYRTAASPVDGASKPDRAGAPGLHR
jgi:transposase